ncbi:hypothetical protein FQN54_000799 [Arachnomyces sp. PD_36]|nr:hypothetical protein FQN54_000799 [Arachnomyces sp. PD_36]
MASNQSIADEFGLPPMSMDLDGFSPAELTDMMGKFTHHQEMMTPKGTHCYAIAPEGQEAQTMNQEQLQPLANGGDAPESHPDRSPNGTPHSFKNESPNPSFFYEAFQAMSTPGNEQEGGLPNINAGDFHQRGASVDTPTSGTLMATPHTGNNSADHHSGFQNVSGNGMHSGFGNGRPPSTSGNNPFVTPSHRIKRAKHQLNGKGEVEIPDASDLIISPVPPPPYAGFGGQPNGAPNGTHMNGQNNGHNNGHNRSLSLPTAPGFNRQTPFHTTGEICKSAECLINSLEAIGAQARTTLAILAIQTEKATSIYDRACSIPNPEERKYFWDRYIGELRAQYDSIRDCLWCCVRYLVSRLSVWCKTYRSILPDPLFARGVAALKIGTDLKVEMDKFRYPEWNSMGIARIVGFHSMNGNGFQSGQPQM